MTDLPHLPARTDWYGLPGEYYRSEELYQRELKQIWRASWLFACPACELPNPGDYLTLMVDHASIILIRDESGIQAFHNLCPHRGTQLLGDSAGHIGKLIICPYHQWTFGRNGKLHNCRGMHDCDSSTLGLRPVAHMTIAGLVFISLAETTPDPSSMKRLLGSAEPQGFETAKVAKAIDYEVAADWKLIWENNRECYHCDAGHPQYVKANFDIAEGDRDTEQSRAAQAAALQKATAYWDAEGLSVKHTTGGIARFPDPDDPDPFPVSATRTIQAEGFETESMDGSRVAPFMGRLKSADVGVLRLRSIPSFWCHASCDHAVITRVLPSGQGRTSIRVTWLVEQSATELIDFSFDRLLPFWQLTSEQDWQLCERAARGVKSPDYRPGPLSRIREYNLETFFRWYLARLH